MKAPNPQYYDHVKWTINESNKELSEGLELLNSIKKPIITVLGSHIFDINNKHYKHCENVSYELGKRGYAIITGGGPGIMRAANSGATRAGTISIGIKAALLKKEQGIKDPIYTSQLSFQFLFVRRFILALESQALIFYPGGYGTLNELFEYVTLVVTGMTDKVPLICVNRKYWKGLFDWMNKTSVKEGVLTEKNLELIQFADDIDEIMGILNKK